MLSMSRALEIAHTVHTGTVDKSGQPVLLHAMRVALALDHPFHRMVAILHDVIEDGPADMMEQLRQAGADPDLLSSLDAVSRRPGEPYREYIHRCLENPGARAVKRQDLLDHLAPERGQCLTVSLAARHMRALKLF